MKTKKRAFGSVKSNSRRHKPLLNRKARLKRSKKIGSQKVKRSLRPVKGGTKRVKRLGVIRTKRKGRRDLPVSVEQNKRRRSPDSAYNEGYNEAYNEGFNAGFAKGYEDGHQLAYQSK
ncbi:hypothetical protein [Paenibacillus sp.]|uniref:hypothetical protein n=1 Tax=Paenibacillus sp. TaxID=58172 RepID=UPI00281CFAA7|nr:hypothetical protein [Paenibacillus sp.]MDR0267004.1 hypothetical protein [Paenibacillus sp.]